MKKSITHLSKEHKNILKLTGALRAKCEEIKSEKSLDKEYFKKAVDFIKNYADKFHHLKEENILFKQVSGGESAMHCGLGPIHQMLHEHDLGRKYVKGIENGIKKNSKSITAKNALEFADLIEDHIFKEENILYPMIEETINAKTDKELIKNYTKQEKESEISEKNYLKLLKDLSE